MKQSSDVIYKPYTSPTVSIVEMERDVVRTSAGEIGVSWNDDWNSAWGDWVN